MSFTSKGRAGLLALLAAAVVVVAPSGPAAAPSGALGQDLDALLATNSLKGADVGLVVRKADTGEVLYSSQSARRRQPASNAKVLTTAAALDLLGTQYRFHTSVQSPGRRAGSLLAGDLYLRGGGDPTMLASDYDALAAQVAASGVRTVSGSLVADDGFFDKTRLAPGWAWDDEPYYYDAQTSALTIAPDTDYDAGSVIVTVKPGAAGAAPTVTLTPPNSYVHVVNTAVTGPGSLTVDRAHGGNTITVSGSIPVGAAPDQEWMAVWEPTGLAASVFRDALARHGVRVLGGTRFAATPAGAASLAGHDSITVGELLTPFLKRSNNMHAEALVKTTGGGSWATGLTKLRQDFPTFGVDPAQLLMVDGSGLSRMDEVSPDELADALLAVRGKPWFQEFYNALPVAGNPDRMVGGTLSTRMVGTPAAGKVHAKTGSMTGVSALSGYVTAADGEQLVFSMVSNQTLGSPRAVEDAVAIRLAQYDGTADVRQAAAPAVRSAAADPSQLECSWARTC
ncbi:D-alanyl-D-alanine carboxypeptidase/D-alanyl-D-alanine-endopeptidase [Amycolatopsis acidiphila]|uniref:D-alanyl-D-alanine carboxypeptidase/D-alanyl-D-alanine-endopeptidase n=1 Tax=Amycolatopsis acidiphila TaxID=715473 RepID=A0A557ZQK5_9PSEU|nr:D-alanyl-D-alanine carboxypeptidase/D-alanyl-D-alanine-endopeptidase [Amycolatopsis acidiphila]TVT14290.1 D-alanyl-D-alanine carboxypeptidase/D-alanyl-D-alanine-endopeptidase [Amycolatopsis acidiphila]UIJ60842.1 D-alanyl-D-alanine carboxypeptidase/D-alanyl-D-alanine-endopeptidase [Amycolatopsis acidiphila]GHG94270.1 D-alanyl-D-alanine carboxypeptidase DacC [Amycolatopsis acidiphila]